MGRKFIDCRDFPGAVRCTVALSADTDQELLQAAVEHGVAVHHHKDSPEFRQQLLHLFKEEPPSTVSKVEPPSTVKPLTSVA